MNPSGRVIQFRLGAGSEGASPLIYALDDTGALWRGEHNPPTGLYEWKPLNLPEEPSEHGVDLPTLQQAERELIRQALERCHGNKAAAARALGVSIRTLYRRLAEHLA